MVNNYDLVLISTCTDSVHIYNLLDSVIKCNQYLKVGMIILLQNDLRISCFNHDSDNVYLHVISSKCMYSLSKARNLCLDYYIRNNLSSEYIMFPDDDTTFDNSFFRNFYKHVTSNMLIDVLCEGTRIPYVSFKNLKDGEYTTCYEHAMSVNMIVKSSHVLAIGGFDESLGVGAKYGAGEDGDYFLRLCKQFGPFLYTNKLWNYHPSAASKYRQISFKKLLRRYKTYGEGVIYLLVKHKLYFKAIKCIVSGFAGAILALLFSLNIKLAIARFYGGITRCKVFFSLLSKRT